MKENLYQLMKDRYALVVICIAQMFFLNYPPHLFESQGQVISRAGNKEHGISSVARPRFYAQTRFLSSRHEAGKFALYGARISQDRRFRISERDSFETSVYGLRVD